MNNVVDKIYELIKNDNSINALYNNKDLFLIFYYHSMSIRYNGSKVIEIYKYLLSLNLDDDNDFLPYINSKIIDDFNKYEQDILFIPFMNDFKADDNYIDVIVKLIDDYNFFFKYKDNAKLDKLIDRLKFIRDYTAGMMVILNSSFFNLSNDNIMLLMNSIKNNEYLKNICETGMGKTILDKDYIFQYCSRYLFTNEFVNYDSYDDDTLLISLKEGKIKDYKLLERIIKNTNIDYLLEVFDFNISNFINMLDNILNDDLIKIKLFNQFINKVEDDEYYIVLLDFIIDDGRFNNYLSQEKVDKTINYLVDNYPTDLTDKQALFLLNNVDDDILKINIKENLKDNNFNDETQRILNDSTKDIIEYNYSFEEAISILDSMFNGEKIDSITCFSCLKTLIKLFLKYDNIKIYLSRSISDYGSADYSTNSITLNLNFINELVSAKKYDNNPEVLHILDTIFHESQHILQYKKMNGNEVESNSYEQCKEELLRRINTGYYKKNYIGVNYEKEARIVGAKTLSNLLSNYFPYLVNCIDYYSKLAEYEETKIYEDKEIFELSDKVTVDEAIEKLVLICPSIVSNYPLLEREYNLDGSRKERKRVKI